MDLAKLQLLVQAMLEGENTSHDWEHIRRVTANAVRLADQEQADLNLVTAAALLHDVDDRKISGDIQTETDLPITGRFLDQARADAETAGQVMGIIQSIGFHKSLGGIEPSTLEGKIVSDADFLDAVGAIGIARCFAYGGAKGRPIFLPNVVPMTDFSREDYIKSLSASVNHFFEKLLKLKDKMYTKAGEKEAQKRHVFMVAYLEALFHEIAAPPDWFALLNQHRVQDK